MSERGEILSPKYAPEMTAPAIHEVEDLLITNQLLYRLSYTSGSVGVLSNNVA